jgi:hypothetical protein
MGNRNKIRFTKKYKGRKGYFWRVAKQPYRNCEISAGLIMGLEPDTIYLRFDRDNDRPTTFMLRRDEVEAIIYVLSGALWSSTIMTMEGK